MTKIATDGTTGNFRIFGIKTNELESNENHKYKKKLNRKLVRNL